MIEVFSPGTSVTIGDDVAAQVVSVQIINDPPRVSYNVEWWEGRTRHEGWFSEWQVREGEVRSPLAIGFKGEQ